jgi:CDP-glycerol glycerophosphotransferase
MRIVYSSFYGRYSDSPRAIHEALAPHLAAQGVDATHVWLRDDVHGEGFPADAVTVPYDSAEALAELGAADVVVANHYLDRRWTKKPGAFYLQTWHGTPLKRIHADTPGPRSGNWAALRADVERWDALLSANAHSTAVFPGAFAFDGEVAETGYPRNDRLLSDGAEAVRARVRTDLGIADGVTAVLYTPTWRDDVRDAQGRHTAHLTLDLQALAADLGPGYVVLVRLHYIPAARVGDLSGPGVVDVSAHPDVAELYLAADLMVTDYSSTMFDFAVTAKPMAFFVDDLEHYRDELRGFYVDLLADAPGPVVRTRSDLAAALRRLAAGDDAWDDAYARFRERYTSLEDGKATRRVLERFFARPVEPPQVVVLAAGLGSRLGRSHPKPLTRLADGRTILAQQLENVRSTLGAEVPVTLVVGHQAEVVTAAAPGEGWVRNDRYATTNTAASLLTALRALPPGGVLWLNGDVVFDAGVLELARPLLERGESFVAVAPGATADEEVKYTLDETGHVAELSKTVRGGLGEAVGINHVAAADRPVLEAALALAGDQDYFEHAVEAVIRAGRARFRALDVGPYRAVEIDDELDLARADELFAG